MQEPFVIAVRILQPRQRAKPRRTPDDRLIHFLPKCSRPHEGLVIKPGGEKRIQPVVDRHRVKLQRRPTVLAFRLQPVKQLRHRRPRVRLGPRAGPQLHQRVRLLRPRRHHSARTVILETAPHQPRTIGQKGRRKRIPRMPRIAHPIECERPLTCPINLPTCNSAHRPRPAARATSRASSTPVISCVTVLRVTTSQDRSPCS